VTRVRTIAAGALGAGLVLAVGLPRVLGTSGAPSPAHPVLRVETPASTREVQEWDQLGRHLARLQDEAVDLGAAGFAEAARARLAAYLRLDEEGAAGLARALDAALADLRAARARLRPVHAASARDPGSAASIARRQQALARHREAQQAAADRLLGPLSATARHALFARERLDWLLRVDYGVQAAER